MSRKLTDEDFEGLTPAEIIEKINAQHPPEVHKIIEEIEQLWDDLYGDDYE